MSLFTVRRLFCLLSPGLFALLTLPSGAATWLPYGPDGGDARSFAVDPANHEHLYLGTANGWIYDSHDSGAHWTRLARIGKRDDLVLDHIVVDVTSPKHLIVGAWVLDHPDGGIFQSFDSGLTWTIQPQMKGQSIRALTAAPSNPKIIVAGTLNGIFRSEDDGAHWNLISPEGSNEIHNFQSIAVAPDNPEIIYGGTRHLPWKTMDGGTNWANIKTGIIDDSDVFSIIVDPTNPRIVYASACSGIYKSEDSGERFRKVQGIPSSARRTRVLRQDPEHLNIVFAGTTEGLWRTTDSGSQWTRTTGPEVIVNDVMVDPENTKHVLLATDRGGVLISEDGGDSFAPSNRGFSARQITAFLVDPQRPGTMYAGLVNDKEWGGVFQSRDGGLNWVQRSDGLHGRDVFSLAQAPDGTLVAGTGHGIFRFEDGFWTRAFDAGMLNGISTVRSPKAGTLPHPVEAPEGAPGNPFLMLAGWGGAPVKHPVPAKRGSAAAKKRPVPARGRAAVVPRGRPRAVVRPAVRPAVRGGRSVGGLGPVRPYASIHYPPPSSVDGMTTGSFDGVVHAMVTVGSKMLAGSSHGMLVSNNSGRGWVIIPTLSGEEWRFLAAEKQIVVAATLERLSYSVDGGATFADMPLPPKVLQISAVAVDGKGEFWVAGREGVFLSSDHGMSWQTLKNLYVRDVDSLFYDPRSDQILVTANGNATIAFGVEIPTRKVTFWDTGWNLRFLRPVGDHLLGATLFDGVVIQPRMVESTTPAGKAFGSGRGGD